MQTWQKVLIIAIPLIAAIIFVVWMLTKKSSSGSPCGNTTYDPNTQTCINGVPCDLSQSCNGNCCSSDQTCVANRCVPNVSVGYSCSNGKCVPKTDGTGDFTTMSECLKSGCVDTTVTYNCTNSKCVPVKGDSGTYSSMQACKDDGCGDIPDTYNCDGGKCVTVTDGSGQYTTMQECIDDSCYSSGAGCYASDIMNMSAVQDNPAIYFVVALYGFKQIADGDYGVCDDALSPVGSTANEDGKFIYVWKRANDQASDTTKTFVRCTSLASGKTYLVRMDGGAVTSGVMYHTPNVTMVQVCDDKSTGDCTANCGDEIKILKAFNICYVQPNADNKLPSAIILTDRAYSGAQCDPEVSPGVSICHTLNPGMDSEQSARGSLFMRSLKPSVSWSRSGVL